MKIKHDIDITSVCRIVQYMYGSAGCDDATNCVYCRFRDFRDAHTRIAKWANAVSAIMGCLLSWADENLAAADILKDQPGLSDLVEKARAIERCGDDLSPRPVIGTKITDMFLSRPALDSLMEHWKNHAWGIERTHGDADPGALAFRACVTDMTSALKKAWDDHQDVQTALDHAKEVQQTNLAAQCPPAENTTEPASKWRYET